MGFDKATRGHRVDHLCGLPPNWQRLFGPVYQVVYLLVVNLQEGASELCLRTAGTNINCLCTLMAPCGQRDRGAGSEGWAGPPPASRSLLCAGETSTSLPTEPCDGETRDTPACGAFAQPLWPCRGNGACLCARLPCRAEQVAARPRHDASPGVIQAPLLILLPPRHREGFPAARLSISQDADAVTYAAQQGRLTTPGARRPRGRSRGKLASSEEQTETPQKGQGKKQNSTTLPSG